MTSAATATLDPSLPGVRADDASPADGTVRTLPIGAFGPSFAPVPAADGRRYGLADFAGARALVLIFTANRCPTAKSHAGRIDAARRRYEPLGVQFVLVNSNDPHLHPEERFDRTVERATRDDLHIPYLSDADQAIARAYGPTCTFHAFVLDAERRLRYEGRFDDARLEERVTKRDVEEALDALLAGREVPVPRTQAFGCSLEILGDQRAFALPRPSGMFPVSAAAETPSVRPLALGAGLSLAAIGSWALLGLAALTGAGSLLNHDALIHGGVNGPPPIWAAILSFAIAWQVMLAAMMIPASGPAIRVVGAALSMRARPVLEAAGFVAAFAAVWSAVGVALFCGDWVLHHIVDATPWLAARPQLIQAAVFATAGAYQLTPWKRRGLAACRDPEGVAACCLPGTSKTGVRAGIRHAIDCLGASWALMLLMFAFGPAALAWMVALTGIMAVEVRARAGSEIALIVGIALLAIAGARLLGVPIAV